MALSKAQKQEIVAEVSASLKEAQVLILAHNKGLTVAEVSDLRRKMRDAGANYRVVKNTLAKLAAEGTPFAATAGMMKGPTAMATSKDPVAAAKVMVDYAKTNEKIVILGGAFGEKALDVKAVEALAKMPSLDQLRATLAGMLQTPAQRIATLLQAPGSQVARVIAVYSKK
jgi:large subunit ribosomal protein L10